VTPKAMRNQEGRGRNKRVNENPTLYYTYYRGVELYLLLERLGKNQDMFLSYLFEA
jgi:hypothetical protein